MENGGLITLLSQPPSEMANCHIPMLRKQTNKQINNKKDSTSPNIFVYLILKFSKPQSRFHYVTAQGSKNKLI